jgi:orotidine-5'-phosphate decarboxylase
MMKAAKRSARRSKILAVTVLTSAKANSQKVKKLTRDALKAGVDGVVCSGRDLPSINRIAGSQSLLKIVPGIRPSWYKKKDDQKRTMTPQKAMELGADFLVIGRPVLDSGDPEKNVKAVFQNI